MEASVVLLLCSDVLMLYVLQVLVRSTRRCRSGGLRWRAGEVCLPEWRLAMASSVGVLAGPEASDVEQRRRACWSGG
jgi:hypothetical protein